MAGNWISSLDGSRVRAHARAIESSGGKTEPRSEGSVRKCTVISGGAPSRSRLGLGRASIRLVARVRHQLGHIANDLLLGGAELRAKFRARHVRLALGLRQCTQTA